MSALKLRDLRQLLQDIEEASTVGIALLYRFEYIGRIVLIETNVSVSNEEVERIVKLQEPPSDKLARKIFNLGKAIDYLLPLSQAVMYGRPPAMLNVELIQVVHRNVMEGLLENAGSFRQKDAAPAGHALYFYKTPKPD